MKDRSLAEVRRELLGWFRSEVIRGIEGRPPEAPPHKFSPRKPKASLSQIVITPARRDVSAYVDHSKRIRKRR